MTLAGEPESFHHGMDRAGGTSDQQPAGALAASSKVEVLDQLRRARLELEFAAEGRVSLAPAVRALRRTEKWLARLPRIAILGEFNSGKSSLANFLTGIESLPTAVVSNTCIPTLLYFANEPSVAAIYEEGRRQLLSVEAPIRRRALQRLEVGMPSWRLRKFQILDLPGLADPNFQEAPVDLAQHGPDAVIWCTVATQAWKESERTAWLSLPDYLRENGVLVVTFGDLLDDPSDKRRVLGRLARDAGPLFREIVMVSASTGLASLRDAGMADTTSKESGGEKLGAALDRLVTRTDERRVTAALAVAGRIASRTLDRLDDGQLAVSHP